MDYPGFGKWIGCMDLLEFFPTDPAFMAAAAEPESPGLHCAYEYDLKSVIVAPNPKILIVTPQLRTQCSILFFDRLMTIFATPLPQPFHKA